MPQPDRTASVNSTSLARWYGCPELGTPASRCPGRRRPRRRRSRPSLPGRVTTNGLLPAGDGMVPGAGASRNHLGCRARPRSSPRTRGSGRGKRADRRDPAALDREAPAPGNPMPAHPTGLPPLPILDVRTAWRRRQSMAGPPQRHGGTGARPLEPLALRALRPPLALAKVESVERRSSRTNSGEAPDAATRCTIRRWRQRSRSRSSRGSPSRSAPMAPAAASCGSPSRRAPPSAPCCAGFAALSALHGALWHGPVGEHIETW